MPPPQKKPVPNAGGKKGAPSKSRTKKNAQPTRRPPMQRVMVLGKDLKIRWEWRPWGS